MVFLAGGVTNSVVALYLNAAGPQDGGSPLVWFCITAQDTACLYISLYDTIRCMCINLVYVEIEAMSIEVSLIKKSNFNKFLKK